MKGDYSRLTFKPDRHYRSVRIQQGRVQVDADWNEQADIQAHRDETATWDAIGRCGAPLHEAGFAITVEGGNLRIGAGRYYVDGILCENEQDVSHAAAPALPGLSAQPDFPVAGFPGIDPSSDGPGTYLVYLDVWQRHITALEDLSIREVALGGPDTATRLKTVWQVKLQKVSSATSGITCDQASSQLPPASAVSTGSLSAQAQPGGTAEGPCVVPPGAGFRRLENQLYRVEIHDGSNGAGTPTYKWSRDNGSIATVIVDINEDDITVSDTGRDATLGFAAGQWVELTDEGRTLRGEPGVLVEVAKVEGNVLTVSSWPGGTRLTLADFGAKPTVRRWDSDGAILLTSDGFVDLEDGVQVKFASGDYRTGDYWTIPARSLEGTVEWPIDNTGTRPEPLLEPRHGIEHHYCPLALLTFDGTTWASAGDCRAIFPPLNELSALEYVGGDGQEAMPDLTQPTALVPLAQPLQVGVANRVGAMVRFHITQGNGQLTGGAQIGSNVDVPTGEDGVASCGWALDSGTLHQQVEAHLLDDASHELSLPVRFNASLSVASQVAYLPPAACTSLQSRNTVQAAIDRLAQLPTLFYVAGDGQETLPTNPQLPQLLQVGVASQCGPVVGAVVRFTAQDGGGRVESTLSGLATATSNTIDIPTDGSGIASCAWQLEGNLEKPSQQLVARLLIPAGEPEPAAIRFTARLSLADHVAYDSSNCADLAAASTVQEAIDLLCQRRAGQEEGVHITGVFIQRDGQRGPVLPNDFNLVVNLLAMGIRLECDRVISPNSVQGKPTCFVTLDMPFPFNQTDRELWGTSVVGSQPLILDGTVAASANVILWNPSPQAQQWLTTRLFPIMRKEGRGNRVLAHLTLKGNFIWASPPPENLYLDGEAFGRPSDSRIDLALPSGDGRRGGDFEMWFWLVAPPEPKTPDVKVTDVKTTEIKVTDVKTTDVKATDVKTADVKVTDVKATDAKIAEVKAFDLPATHSIDGPIEPPVVRVRHRAPQGRAFITPDERPEPGR